MAANLAKQATIRASTPLQFILQKRRLISLYQPIVNLRQKCIHGWEALSRGPLESQLHHPLVLFQQAREEGLLVALEQLSKEKAIEGFARQALPGHLFLNVSPDLLIQPEHAPGQTLAWLNHFGLDPKNLVIELTEQQPTHDFDLMRQAIDHYQAMGFRIALDDLGSGYSGLRLWSELRPDYVKVDRHFVHQVKNDRVKQDFLRFINNMARSLGTQVIAEGVETLAELEVLQELGIELVQGYYFSRPQSQPNNQLKISLPGIHSPKPSVGNHEEQARALLCKVRAIQPDMSVAEAVELFRQDEELFSLPVIDRQNRPRGLLLRNQLMSTLLRPFGQELNYRKPVSNLMHDQPLIVEAALSLEEVSQQIIERRREHLDDDFIITSSGQYLGIGQVVDLLRTMTELKVRNARQANPLTLLPGNGPIQETLDAWLKIRQPLVVCYLDLDNFKVFNDTYGYALGDELLKSLASSLQKSLHPHADFIGHLGGDDFVAICRSEDWYERMLHLLHDFSNHVQTFYCEEDRAAGGIHADDRYGVRRFFSFVAVSIAALSTEGGDEINAHKLAADVSHLKHFAKKVDGSSLVLQKNGQQQILWPGVTQVGHFQ